MCFLVFKFYKNYITTFQTKFQLIFIIFFKYFLNLMFFYFFCSFFCVNPSQTAPEDLYTVSAGIPEDLKPNNLHALGNL